MPNKITVLEDGTRSLLIENCRLVIFGNLRVSYENEQISPEKLYQREEDTESEEKDRVNLHTHLYTEIFFCSDGQTTVSTEKEAVVLMENDIMIIPPGVPHKISEKFCSGRRFGVGFMCQQRNGGYYHDFYSSLALLAEGNEYAVLHSCEDLVAERSRLSVETGEISPEDLPGYCRLLLHLSDKYRKYRDAIVGAGDGSVFEDGSINRVFRLETIIANSYMTNVSVSGIADAMSVSERQLARIVKEQYGCSLWQLILDKRLQAAEILLSQTDMPVSKISGQVGFNYESAFYRTFLKKYGETPAQYRKRMKDQEP